MHSAMPCDREVFLCWHNSLLDEFVIRKSLKFSGSSFFWTVLPLQVWKQESLRQHYLLWIQQCSLRPATSSKTLIDLSLLPLKLADLLKMLSSELVYSKFSFFTEKKRAITRTVKFYSF